MSGLIFVALAVLWIMCVLWFIRKMKLVVPDRAWKGGVGAALVVLLIPLPWIDEIVGGWQFSRLCKDNIVRADRDSARGRSVYLEIKARESVPGMWVSTWRTSYNYVDVSTGEVIAGFDRLKSDGGRFTPRLDAGPAPLLFKGECYPSGVFDRAFIDQLGLVVRKSE